MKRFAFVLAAIFIAGCTRVQTQGTGPEASRHPYTQPHVLRFATAEDITGLNPMFADQAVVFYLAQMTMAWLIRTGPDGQSTVPELCTEVPTQKNGGISPDGKAITYHIRKGVKWSDGAAFDADDVVFSVQQILNPKNNVISREGWDLIKKVDEPDKYTVVLHLTKPYAAYAVTFFSTGGANPAIVPKHLLSGRSELNDAPYNSKPVGIGPFVYQSWKRSDSVNLVASPNYWRGKPKLQRIVYRLIPDRETVANQMSSHELDLWTPVSPHYVPRMRKVAGVAVDLKPSLTYDHLDFNVRHPLLRDRAVREALRFATPRAEANEKIRFGLYELGEPPVTPATVFHDSSIALIPYDIGKANALLDGAGWTRGADGVRIKAGQRLAFDFALPSGSPDADAQVELFRAAWKQIGAEIVLRHYSTPLFFAQQQAGGIIYGGKFDVTAFAWGLGISGDLSNPYSCQRFPPNGQNVLFWCNEEVSAAIARSQVSYDQEQRKKDIDTAQKLIVEDVPTVVLDYRKYIVAHNTDLKNFHPPNDAAPFDDMMNVDI